SLLGGMGGVTWKWLEANEHARQADEEKRAAQYLTYRASMAAASAAVANGDVADAARHLEAAPEGLRGWEGRHLHTPLDESSSLIRLPASRPWSPDSILIPGPDRVRIGTLTSAGLHVTYLDGGEDRTVPIAPDRRRRIYAAQTDQGLRVVAWV